MKIYMRMFIALRAFYAVLFVAGVTGSCRAQAPVEGPGREAQNANVAIAGKPIVAANPLWDQSARLLAGLEPQGEVEPGLAPWLAKPEFALHRQEMDRLFDHFENTFLSKMRAWSASELGNPGTPVLFYPFGGPEIIISQSFFPFVEEYILCGLEKPGPPPALAKIAPERVGLVLENLRGSLDWLVHYTYFQTIQMNSQLHSTEVLGTGPLMMVFLARTGNRILDATSVFLGPNGQLREIALNTSGGINPPADIQGEGIWGIRIRFEKNGIRRQATYFSFDASDPAMATMPWFFEYVRGRGQRSVYLKAASYLLHWGNFPTLTDFLLDESRLILSDDTGIPYKKYDPARWDLAFYGNYEAPIPLFAGQYQEDLRQVYLTPGKSRPLPFEIGYTISWKPGISSLVLAKRKN